jgi:hypothetical protein
MNRPLPPNPRLVGNSDAMIARILSFGKLEPIRINAAPHGDYMHPYFFSKPTDPLYTVDGSRPDSPDGLKVRIPAAAKPAGGEDHHLAVYDQQGGYEYSFFEFPDSRPAGGGTITVGLAQVAKISGNGGGDDEIRGYSNAAGTGLMGGVVRYPEIVAGRIDHAIFLISGRSDGKLVYPARSFAQPCRLRDCPPEGQWLKLDMSAVEIDALPVADWQKTIYRALAKYGGWVGDQGGNEALAMQVEGPTTWSSFGLANPWVAWAAARQRAPRSHINTYDDGTPGVTRYALDVFKAPIDWRHRLQAVDPCVIERTC